MCDRNSDPTTYDEPLAGDTEEFQRLNEVTYEEHQAEVTEFLLKTVPWSELLEWENAQTEFVVEVQRVQDGISNRSRSQTTINGEPVSSWVKRNLDGAQYAQPRGSQYEG